MRYFVTGTDTGVGKTFATSAIAERGRLRGLRVFAWKPIETGCKFENGHWLGEDQEKISSDWQVGAHRGVYQFQRPAAPLMAAQSEDRRIDLDALTAAFQTGSSTADLVIVEGAGGWRVPITEDVDMAGLAGVLEIPIIVVARGGLGTINHTLLTIEAIRRDHQSIAAVILSRRPDEDAAFVDENAREIGRRSGVRLIVLGADPSVLDELVSQSR